MLNAWKIAKKNKGLRQQDLSKALGTTQSAVSKLLNSEDTHIWTSRYLVEFCKFTETKLSLLVPDDLLPLIEGWKERELDSDLLALCEQSVERFFSRQGKAFPNKLKLAETSAAVCTHLETLKDHPSPEQIENAILSVIMEQAIGNLGNS